MASETTDDAELIERLRGPVFGTSTALDAAAAIETWKARAERLADMHRDMCVVAGEAIARAERAEAELEGEAQPVAIDVERFKAKYREFWPSAWPDNALMAKEFDEVLRASITAAIAKATS